MSSPILTYCLKEWEREKEMRLQDAYKWLFHATQGGDHAIQSPNGPRAWLAREWKSLDAEPRRSDMDTLIAQELVQWLRPDARIVRLHLRPYRALGGKPEPLLAAFVASAKSFRGDKPELKKLWAEFGAIVDTPKAGDLVAMRKLYKTNAALLAEYQQYSETLRETGWPAVDHSTVYEKARRPAYRVLTRAQASELISVTRAANKAAR